MTREARVVFSTSLMLLAYAAWALFENGGFIFPIPLNEPIFFVVSIIFLFMNLKKPFLGIFAVVTATSWLLTTQFFWSFFYGHATMEALSESLVTDFSYLVFILLLLTAGIYTGIKQKHPLGYLLMVLFVVALSASVLLNESIFLLFAFSTMAISTQIVKVAAPFHLLWMLLFILKAGEWLSYLLN
ncbi:MAG: hypothetical protein ACI865_003246 [Flavobacteriaceae bacterium]|jgi:hypothetical protein